MGAQFVPMVISALKRVNFTGGSKVVLEVPTAFLEFSTYAQWELSALRKEQYHKPMVAQLVPQDTFVRQELNTLSYHPVHQVLTAQLALIKLLVLLVPLDQNYSVKRSVTVLLALQELPAVLGTLLVVKHAT